jgi:CRP-like cAMP-binding protein
MGWRGVAGDIYFFSGLSLSHARGLLEVGYKKRYPAGAVLVEMGSKITDFCVLLLGLVEATYTEEGETSKMQWSMGDWFGEEVLLTSRDREMYAGEEVSQLVGWSAPWRRWAHVALFLGRGLTARVFLPVSVMTRCAR